MTKQTKKIEKPQKETVETILDNTLLDLTLSEIAAFGFQKPTMTTYPAVPEKKDPEKQETISDTTIAPKNENALSINIVVAFCWWAVNYVIESVTRTICNYLKETPISQEHTEPRFPFDLEKMKANEPAAFEVIMIGKNIINIVEIGDMAYMVDVN
ncbi:MAG: hypothetical protein LN560_03920 [Rickettsia endosymbiont of Sceptobius lativentris]|nr:hypothetical protein [Rickettsia endosymbiont of Sceptobius lativentris]